MYDNTGSMGHEGTNEVNQYAFNFNNIINNNDVTKLFNHFTKCE